MLALRRLSSRPAFPAAPARLCCAAGLRWLPASGCSPPLLAPRLSPPLLPPVMYVHMICRRGGEAKAAGLRAAGFWFVDDSGVREGELPRCPPLRCGGRGWLGMHAPPASSMTGHPSSTGLRLGSPNSQPPS